MAGRAYLAVDGGRRCAKSGCNGWATRTGQFCAGHDPHAQALSRAVIQLKKRGLQLPELDSTKSARRWLAIVGAATAEGRLKTSVARELRLTASAYLASDRDGALADRLSELEQRLRDGEEAEEVEDD